MAAIVFEGIDTPVPGYHYIRIGRRRKGKRFRIHFVDGRGKKIYPPMGPSPEFLRAYQYTIQLAEGIVKDRSQSQFKGKTFSALVDQFLASPDFKKLAKSTKRDYTVHLQEIKATWGNLAVSQIRRRNALLMRDELADTPRTADIRMSVLSRLITYSLDYDYRETHPFLKIKRLANSQAYEPWTAEALTRILTKGQDRVVDAVMVFLYTGQRASDIVEMKRDYVPEGKIKVVQEKTGKPLWIPIHKTLKRHLEKRKIAGTGPLLVNLKGERWTVRGLHRAILDDRISLALEDFVPHGLRKNAVCALLEAGCTVNEVSSITGQTAQMVEHYTREVNQLKLAEEAIRKWEAAGN